MDAIERALKPVWEAIARLKGSVPGGGSVLVEDPYPVFTATVNPRIWNMPWAYVQNWIDAEVGPKRLVAGVDFTASGTVFTFDLTNWPNGPDGQDFVVFRARR